MIKIAPQGEETIEELRAQDAAQALAKVVEAARTAGTGRRVVLGPSAVQQMPALAALVDTLQKAGLREPFLLLPMEASDDQILKAVQKIGTADSSVAVYADHERDEVSLRFVRILRERREALPVTPRALPALSPVVQQVLLDLGVPQRLASNERFLADLLAAAGLAAAA